MSAGEAPRRSYADSYAGARARVAPNSKRAFLEEGATATKRWTREETQARVADAPKFRHSSPGSSLLRDLVDGYQHITGDVVMRPAKVNLIATCYRLHGDAFLPLVARLFASKGTVSNLLGEIRCLAPQTPLATQAEVGVQATEPGTPLAADPMPDPPNSLAEPHPVGPGSGPHDHREPSNADAGTLFSDEELGIPSPTARALTR
jgi:hypothetical protein